MADRDALVERFLKLSGYKEKDLVGINEKTRTFVTENGGKYTMNREGKALRTLLGPAFPKSKGAASEGETE